MREIRFRGMQKDLAHEQFPDVYGKNKMPFVYGVGVFRDDYNTWVIQEGKNRCFSDVKGKIVDPESVGQYTGLKDKNGAEIYEGDVVVFCDYASMKAEIIYDFSGFEFKWLDKSMISLRRCKSEPMFRNTSIVAQVIGNIHDNPSLLEVQP